LAEIQDGAALTIQLNNAEGDLPKIALKEVLAGKTVSIWNGTAVVRLVSTASPVALGKNEDDHPAACYGPDGTLWVAYVSYHVKEDSRRIEPPQLKDQPENFKAYDTPGFGELVMVQTYRGGKWSEPTPIRTGAMEDIARVAITCDGQGNAWVAYSAQRNGNYDIYSRLVALREQGQKNFFEVGNELRVTNNPGPDLSPVLCTDSFGIPWLAFQSWAKNGNAEIQMWKLDRTKGEWRQEGTRPARDGENHWHPAIAAGPNGQVAVACDCYRSGNYDVLVDTFEAGIGQIALTAHVVATSPKFEARPSIAYDKDGRLWIAYEEGPEKWGKDYGALDTGDGNPLYNERSVRVVCLEADGKLTKPKAELPTARYDPPILPFEPVKTSKYESTTRYAYPKIGLDGKGRVWLTHRQNFGTRYTTHPGPYWLTFARRLDSDRWSEPVELHHSDGLLDHRPVLLPHVSGGLLVVHNTDGRLATPDVIDNQIYASVVNLPAENAKAELVAHSPGSNPMSKHVQEEKAAVARMKQYRLEAGGKKYQLLRGEYHRHTEMSWDGAPDGSLEDMFRYAIDAAAMDWIGNGDHDNGAGREYSWHLTQKWTDAYHVANAFTPMFTYERSVPYPHGHRNVMFERRGIRTLPRLAAPEGVKAEGGVHENDTKMLYRYLKEFGGICAIHTSATSMGTDWRDNDPVAEPLVEIYQGDRMSYEMENAPRAGFDPKTDKLPANVAGWFPKGFVNLALHKGIKFGFQASSDHWSTHISYMIVIAEEHSRKGILDAVKQRHVYGATDNILVEFRSGDKIMGDELTVAGNPTFQVFVHGTNTIRKIDVLRDSEVVATISPKDAVYKGDWTDPEPQAGTHYYYIRVLQADQEIAWGSPIWVTRK
ncbi:MAG: hypothetical protein L0215_15290, partial [Gemmataceae bacterium]|nr:hypothetical protein [Gemmataceae bacterium]